MRLFHLHASRTNELGSCACVARQGFVPAGLRARAVEAAGRRDGGSDGVAYVMAHGLGPPPGRDGGGRSDGGAASDGGVSAGFGRAAAPAAERQARAPSNGPLLKALLCAALYPQIVVVEGMGGKEGGGKEGGGKGGGKGGGGKGGRLKFLVREVGGSEPVAVALHPSSVNARESRFESKYLIYAEMIRTTQVYVRDSSPVSPYALMLFGGMLESLGRLKGGRSANSTPRDGARGAEDSSTLVVDSWIKFRVPRRVEDLILDVRAQLSSLLMRKIEKPELEFSTAGRGILHAVTTLLAAPPPDV
jgi:hypothetical protein